MQRSRDISRRGLFGGDTGQSYRAKGFVVHTLGRLQRARDIPRPRLCHGDIGQRARAEPIVVHTLGRLQRARDISRHGLCLGDSDHDQSPPALFTVVDALDRLQRAGEGCGCPPRVPRRGLCGGDTGQSPRAIVFVVDAFGRLQRSRDIPRPRLCHGDTGQSLRRPPTVVDALDRLRRERQQALHRRRRQAIPQLLLRQHRRHIFEGKTDAHSRKVELEPGGLGGIALPDLQQLGVRLPEQFPPLPDEVRGLRRQDQPCRLDAQQLRVVRQRGTARQHHETERKSPSNHDRLPTTSRTTATSLWRWSHHRKVQKCLVVLNIPFPKDRVSTKASRQTQSGGGIGKTNIFAGSRPCGSRAVRTARRRRAGSCGLRVRPIFHWTERRIRAHLAIAFMTLLCVRHLSWRTRIQQRQASPEAIRRALVRVQCSILGDRSTGRRYVLPSAIGELAQKLYAVMGLKRTTEAFELTAPSGRNRS